MFWEFFDTSLRDFFARANLPAGIEKKHAVIDIGLTIAFVLAHREEKNNALIEQINCFHDHK
jgi:hypothetical protein